MTKENRMKAAAQMLSRPGAKSDPQVMSHIYVQEFLSEQKIAPESTYEKLKEKIKGKK